MLKETFTTPITLTKSMSHVPVICIMELSFGMPNSEASCSAKNAQILITCDFLRLQFHL